MHTQWQAVNGILLFDKPQGMSSNFAMQKVRKLFKSEKAGHGGTLDPMATGLLPICFGEATKFSTQLLEASKTYEFTCQLGVKTDSGDADGTVIETMPVSSLTKEQILAVVPKFLGEISQIPPMYSALNHEGVRLYELARQGIEIERPARRLNILALDLLSFTDNTFTIRVSCSKGTYIRVLAEDIAHALGSCGHLSMLRRISIEPFYLPALITLEMLTEDPMQFLLPLDTCLQTLPKITLSDLDAARFLQGQRIKLDLILDNQITYRVYDDQEQFLGTAVERHTSVLAPKRLIKLPLSS